MATNKKTKIAAVSAELHKEANCMFDPTLGNRKIGVILILTKSVGDNYNLIVSKTNLTNESAKKILIEYIAELKNATDD